jgi:predicted nucleotidyltransferase
MKNVVHRFGLKEEVILSICNIFRGYPEIKSVILYGSRARGNFRQGSDIDLTIIGELNGQYVLQKIENQLDDLLLPYTIDLSLFGQITSEELLQEIHSSGKVFYIAES